MDILRVTLEILPRGTLAPIHHWDTYYLMRKQLLLIGKSYRFEI